MKLFFYIALFFFCSSFAQEGATESLIVVHYDTEGTSEIRQAIYRYDFVNNAFTGKEKLLTVTGKKDGKDYLRFDNAENTIYKDRYLISSIGNIVDLKEKKVLHDGTAKLVRCSNDSIIFYTNDIFKGKYFSYYDLKTNTYSEIKKLTFRPILGQEVEFDRTQSPYKLLYFPRNKPKEVLLEDAGHGGVSKTYKLGGIPIFWVDNNTFLFPNVKVSNLEGSIVKYDLTTKTAKEIGTFNSSATQSPGYRIEKTKNSFVEFYFKDKLYLINPIKETMLQTNYKEFDSNFSVEIVAKPTGRGVWYKGKEVGRNHFEIKNFKASAGYAAIVKELQMGDELYQQGIAIFNITKSKWEDVEAENVASLVGWIKP